MDISAKAQQIVDEAFEQCVGFPPDRAEIKEFVKSEVDLFYADGTDLRDMLLETMWREPVDNIRPVNTALDVLNVVIRQVIKKEADELIEERFEELAVQKEEWDAVLNKAEVIGLSCTHWNYNDYSFLVGVHERIIDFTETVYSYISAPLGREEAARKNMETAQPAVLGIPATDNMEEWSEFYTNLHFFTAVLDEYIDLYGGNIAYLYRQRRKIINLISQTKERLTSVDINDVEQLRKLHRLVSDLTDNLRNLINELLPF